MSNYVQRYEVLGKRRITPKKVLGILLYATAFTCMCAGVVLVPWVTWMLTESIPLTITSVGVWRIVMITAGCLYVESA